MRDLGELVAEDSFWDPHAVRLLSDDRLREKFGQTFLSGLSYHRDKVRNSPVRLKLGQQLGLLLWLNRHHLLSTKGEERLLFLQARAPWGALEAGMTFAQRLESDRKLVSDLYHWMVVFNCYPTTRRLRIHRARRIGVGYRDKGTLPDKSRGARRSADSSAWVHWDSLPEHIQELISVLASQSVEGEWVDLPDLVSNLQSGLGTSELRLLLDL